MTPSSPAHQAASQSVSEAAIEGAAPAGGRRAAYSASTKNSLVDVATQMFTEHGYAATSLDAIVAGATVTKGALYHHYSGKQALFEAVFDRVEKQSAQHIQAATRTQTEPWDMVGAALRAFLEVMREPAYSRVIMQDGPAVLGYERYREHIENSTLATVVDVVRTVISVGTWRLDDEMLSTFSRIFFGALTAAGASITASPDPQAAADRAEAAIGFLLAGIRGLVEQGVELPPLMRT